MQTIPLAEAKAHLSAIADQVSTTQDRIEVTRHGRRALVIMSTDEWDQIEDTIFWASNAFVDIQQYDEDRRADALETFTHDQVEAWVAAGMPDDEPTA